MIHGIHPMRAYEPPRRPFEYLRERDGIRYVQSADDKHEWRFADAESAREWHRRQAAYLERLAADYLDDARDLRGCLSGSGAEWHRVFNDLAHVTRRAIECASAARHARREEEAA
jgi:hypothetical protein